MHTSSDVKHRQAKPDVIAHFGPNFAQRWRAASAQARREIYIELKTVREMLIQADEFPLLAPEAEVVNSPIPAKKENPFLPRSILDRLNNATPKAPPLPKSELKELAKTIEVRALAAKTYNADNPEQLSLRLEAIVESAVEQHIDSLKNELRRQLRAEINKLVSETDAKV